MEQDPTQTLATLRYASREEPRPATNKNYIRLYGHHLCLYEEKVRLALVAKHIQFQRVDMDLVKEAQWHLDFNEGRIPFIETTDGVLLNESKVLLELANTLGGDNGLAIFDKDPFKAA